MTTAWRSCNCSARRSPGDPKRCVIILTESEAVANIAETIIKL